MPSPTPRGYRDRTGQVTYTLVERHSSVSPVEDFEVNRELMRHTLEQARQHQDQEDESEDEDEQDHEDQNVQIPDEDDGLLHEDVDEGHSHQLEDPEDGEDELDVLGIPAAQVDGTVEEGQYLSSHYKLFLQTNFPSFFFCNKPYTQHTVKHMLHNDFF